jgi:hypothetical protein
VIDRDFTRGTSTEETAIIEEEAVESTVADDLDLFSEEESKME